MCSEGILTLKELSTASLDGYIYIIAPISSRAVKYKRGHFFILYRLLKKRKKKGIMNRKDHSSSVF